MTALRMAKGIAGKMGVPFAVIDTEARSASKYADRFAFDVDDLSGKTIDHYLASMNDCIMRGYRVLVIDSLSHAWRELTDEVDRIAQGSTSKNTFSPWAKVNPKQKRFIDAILNFPGHIIATMRSNTEWVIGEGRSGKLAPEKVGLKPEQGKGIEFEFDLLVELDQQHQGTVTKDRTGKFQDETIDKPGEDFGIALYEWLAGDTAPAVPAIQAVPSVPAVPLAPPGLPESPVPRVQTPTKGEKPKAPKVPSFPPEDNTAKTALKERGKKIVEEIGGIITAVSTSGKGYFTEGEKEEAREIIRTAPLDETGIGELGEFKAFLEDERKKREAGQTAAPAA
jgi:hypothetical protein